MFFVSKGWFGAKFDGLCWGDSEPSVNRWVTRKWRKKFCKVVQLSEARYCKIRYGSNFSTILVCDHFSASGVYTFKMGISLVLKRSCFQQPACLELWDCVWSSGMDRLCSVYYPIYSNIGALWDLRNFFSCNLRHLCVHQLFLGGAYLIGMYCHVQ